jgi:hypothetical protein
MSDNPPLWKVGEAKENIEIRSLGLNRSAVKVDVMISDVIGGDRAAITPRSV